MSFDAFDALTRLAQVVPVTRAVSIPRHGRALPKALAAQGSGFVLESAATTSGGWEGPGIALVGFAPRAVWRAWGHRVEMFEGGVTTTSEDDRPLESLFRHVGRRPVLAGLPQFSGGLVGYLGWGAVRWFEPRVPARLGADPKFPDAEFMLVDDLVAFDWSRETATATLIANVDPSRFADTTAAYRAAQESLDRLEQTLADRVADTGPLTGLAAGLTAPFAHDDTERASFEAGVAAVLEHLHAGDCMQTVLSRRVTLGYSGEPLDLYERLRQASPVAYHFMVRFAEAGHERRAVIGASPELLVRVRDGHVTVRPIAGTRPRGATPAEDAAYEAELRADPKELAEHVMLVDLGRNDVGRVARPGSVRVEEREVIERFSHVMHLTSQVGGTLRADLTPLDALAATFPAGTVSGAPKVRALEIIDALEPKPRGPYGGAVGTVCYDGSIVMAIHLRSVALAGQELRLQAGAGIVEGSIPSRELAETEAKLAAVRSGLGLQAFGVPGDERWRRW